MLWVMRCPGGHTTTVDLVGSNPLIPTNPKSLRTVDIAFNHEE
jgi:hypothetical protein